MAKPMPIDFREPESVTGGSQLASHQVPFALTSLNSLGVDHSEFSEQAEGALLSSLASLLIPSEIATLEIGQYRELRESFSSVRSAFKELTAELARVNRLNRIQDPRTFLDKVETSAQEFFDEYKAFRKSRYARGFKKWTPLYIGGVLAAVATVVAPHVALEIAGASLGIQVIQKRLEMPGDHPERERTFNMLAAMRKDVIRRTGIRELI